MIPWRLEGDKMKVQSELEYKEEKQSAQDYEEEMSEQECENEENSNKEFNDEEQTEEACAKSNMITEKVLMQFVNWLQGIDGGRREQKTAKNYAAGVSSIIYAADTANFSIISIFNAKLGREKWLIPLEKKRQPGTCKSYLGSLSKFLRFLMVENLPEITVKQDDIRTLKEQVQECSTRRQRDSVVRAGDLNREDPGSNPRLGLLNGIVLGNTRGKFTTICK